MYRILSQSSMRASPAIAQVCESEKKWIGCPNSRGANIKVAQISHEHTDPLRDHSITSLLLVQYQLKFMSSDRHHRFTHLMNQFAYPTIRHRRHYHTRRLAIRPKTSCHRPPMLIVSNQTMDSLNQYLTQQFVAGFNQSPRRRFASTRTVARTHRTRMSRFRDRWVRTHWRESSAVRPGRRPEWSGCGQ